MAASFSPAPARRHVLMFIILSLASTLSFALLAPLNGGGHLTVVAVMGGCACLCSALLLLPLLIAPHVWSQSGMKTLVFFACLALTAWVPSVALVVLLSDNTASTLLSMLAVQWPVLTALGAAPSLLLPSLPRWVTLLPAVSSAAALVAVVGAFFARARNATADGATAAEVGGVLVASGISVVIGFFLLLCQPSAGSALDSIVVLPESDSRAATDDENVREENSEGLAAKRARWMMAGGTGHDASRVSRSCASRISSRLPTFRPSRPAAGGRLRPGMTPPVDLRSNVDLARTRLQQLETSLAALGGRGGGSVLQVELAKAIGLLEQQGRGQTTFDWGCAHCPRTRPTGSHPTRATQQMSCYPLSDPMHVHSTVTHLYDAVRVSVCVKA